MLPLFPPTKSGRPLLASARRRGTIPVHRRPLPCSSNRYRDWDADVPSFSGSMLEWQSTLTEPPCNFLAQRARGPASRVKSSAVGDWSPVVPSQCTKLDGVGSRPRVAHFERSAEFPGNSRDTPLANYPVCTGCLSNRPRYAGRTSMKASRQTR